MACTANDHTLSNLGVGVFEILLSIQGEPMSSALHQFFEVVTIDSGVPEILVPSDIELVAVSTGGAHTSEHTTDHHTTTTHTASYAGDISMEYGLAGAASNVISQIEICIDMENVNTGIPNIYVTGVALI
jgi:hypothetical protein